GPARVLALLLGRGERTRADSPGRAAGWLLGRDSNERSRRRTRRAVRRSRSDVLRRITSVGRRSSCACIRSGPKRSRSSPVYIAVRLTGQGQVARLVRARRVRALVVPASGVIRRIG